MNFKSIIRSILSIPCRLYIESRHFSNKQVNTKEEVIVSLTSWKKRIGNVKYVIDSIYANTIKPDKVVLNLSLEEFPCKLEELPDELVQLEHNNLLEIIWNEGNTKAFKKFIPTMKKYPNDIIIAIDDDFIYPTDFIETFVKKHREIPCYPLSGNLEIYSGVKAHCGCASLIKRKYFGKYLDVLLDENIVNMKYDDIFYTFCVTLNGLHYEYVGKLFYTNMQTINPVFGISDDTGSAYGNIRDYLVEKIKRKYHLNLSELSKPIFWI